MTVVALNGRLMTRFNQEANTVRCWHGESESEISSGHGATIVLGCALFADRETGSPNFATSHIRAMPVERMMDKQSVPTMRGEPVILRRGLPSRARQA